MRLQEQTTAINERLILSSIRQHELTEAAEKLNADLQAEIDGQLRKIMVVIGPWQTEYTRLTTGLPERIGQLPHELAPEPKAKT